MSSSPPAAVCQADNHQADNRQADNRQADNRQADTHFIVP